MPTDPDYLELTYLQRLPFIDRRLSERGIVRSGNSPGRWQHHISSVDAELCAEAAQAIASIEPHVDESSETIRYSNTMVSEPTS